MDLRNHIYLSASHSSVIHLTTDLFHYPLLFHRVDIPSRYALLSLVSQCTRFGHDLLRIDRPSLPLSHRAPRFSTSNIPQTVKNN